MRLTTANSTGNGQRTPHCAVCALPLEERNEIDRALAAGASSFAVAETLARFGGPRLNGVTIHRHSDDCLPQPQASKTKTLPPRIKTAPAGEFRGPVYSLPTTEFHGLAMPVNAQKECKMADTLTTAEAERIREGAREWAARQMPGSSAQGRAMNFSGIQPTPEMQQIHDQALSLGASCFRGEGTNAQAQALHDDACKEGAVCHGQTATFAGPTAAQVASREQAVSEQQSANAEVAGLRQELARVRAENVRLRREIEQAQAATIAALEQANRPQEAAAARMSMSSGREAYDSAVAWALNNLPANQRKNNG